MALDTSNDFKVFDDPVTVAYRSKTGEGQWAAAEYVAHCQLSSIDKDDVVKNPKLLTQQSAVLHCWRKCLGFLVPKAGDKLEVAGDACALDPAGAVFVVQSVTVADRDRKGPQRYRLVLVRSTGAQAV